MPTKIRIVSCQGYDDHRDKLDASVSLFEQALNHPLLEAVMLNFRASARMPRMLRTNGLDQAAVLAELRAGSATRKVGRQRVIELHVELDPEVNKHAIGCTQHGVIYTAPHWFHRNPPAYMAGHLAHEYAHLAGFRHAYARTPRRHLTVPYAVGELVSEVAERIQKGKHAVTDRRVDTILRTPRAVPLLSSRERDDAPSTVLGSAARFVERLKYAVGMGE